MPESHQGALRRASRLGFPKSAVVKSTKGGWFIAPHGITTAKAKHAYANCRAGGGAKST